MPTGRRKFIQTIAGFSAGAFAGVSFKGGRAGSLLSFSTLGCPDWTFENIVDFAAANRYDGIEVRGIQRVMDLPRCAAFSNAQHIRASLDRVKSKGLQFVNLGASTELHHPEGPERQRHLDEAKRFIDLAVPLHCPYIRVFPNRFPQGQEHHATLDLIAKGLLALGDYAKAGNVTVLMETHGDVVKTADLVSIMQWADHSHTGLVWDAINMWSVTKEPPAQVYPQLKKWIRHAHIKDLKMADGKERYTLLGKGESPIFEAVDALRKGGYEGYYSFEWEKLWHPEIDAPETALADYPTVMRQHFGK